MEFELLQDYRELLLLCPYFQLSLILLVEDTDKYKCLYCNYQAMNLSAPSFRPSRSFFLTTYATYVTKLNIN